MENVSDTTLQTLSYVLSYVIEQVGKAVVAVNGRRHCLRAEFTQCLTVRW